MTPPDKKELERFSKAVRAQRQLLRYKQKDIAQMVGINARTQANVENARHYPSMPVYFKLCAVLQLPKPPFAP